MKNLVLVSLDTLRADVAYSGQFPTIERVRRAGATLHTVVSSSPLTPVSHATVFSGCQPDRHGVRHLLREQIDSRIPLLAEILRAHGYRNGGVVACPGMNAWYGFARGFECYDDWVPPLADGRDATTVADVELRGTALKRASMVTDLCLEWIEPSSSRPQFLFAHYFDSHWPYEPPDTYGVECNNPYEGEVAYADHHLGELLAGLEARGFDATNSVFCVFSDHGEDLGGWYPNDHSHLEGYRHERGHGCLLFDATQLVPLVFVADNISPGSTISDQVRLVDVLPTLLELLELECTVDIDGRSIVPLLTGATLPPVTAHCETYYPEELVEQNENWRGISALSALRTPAQKTITDVPSGSSRRFDLVADPLELQPLPAR